MSIEMSRLPTGEVNVRQSFDAPAVYMDHWALMTFAEDREIQDRFVSALQRKRGTLLISNISLAEFAGPSDQGHCLAAENFLERVLPHIYLTDFAFDKVLVRESLEPNNTKRFWPSADLPQMKLLAELSLKSTAQLTIKKFVSLSHEHRVRILKKTSEIVTMVVDALEDARNNSAYVFKAKITLPSDARPRTAIIMGELMRGFNLDNNARITDNDVIDFMHAIVPINCCDFVLLDGSWVGRVNAMAQRIDLAGLDMPIAKCFSKTRNGGLDAFLSSLESFVQTGTPAIK